MLNEKVLIFEIIGVDGYGPACEDGSSCGNKNFNEWVHGLRSFLWNDGYAVVMDCRCQRGSR